VNTKALQLALREWRSHLARPEPWVALVAVAAVLTLVAPFESDETMRVAPRFAYWFFIAATCYVWGFSCDLFVRTLKGARWTWTVVSALLTACGVLSIVMLVNALTLGYIPSLSELPIFMATVMCIALIVSFSMSYFGQQMASTAPEPQSLPILDRLPLDKRGPLVALSVEDHYVRVQTLKGEELLLMRLSDAMREVGSTEGAQVHRSHWAAFGQVEAARREGDRAILTMTTGTEIPVSRANLSKIKEAGLMPERA
jgi:hypothetical protein